MNGAEERMISRFQRVRRVRLAITTVIVTALHGPAFAWGVAGHRHANRLAVESLPKQLKPLYEANKAWIVQHSVDPDEWRRTDRAEAPYHFIDLDTWGLANAAAYPEDYWVAVGLYGKEEVDKNGVVPWRIGQYYAKLVRAFKDRDPRRIVETSTWLGHYVADAHVPFHAVANYDGQLTGQKGIHARWESVLVERQIQPQDLKTSSVRLVKKPVTEAFVWTREGLKQHFDVLSADKAAVTKDAAYGDTYYAELGAKTRSLAVRRLEESGAHLASLWYSAWVEAGKPTLPEAKDVHAGEPLDKPTADPDRKPGGSSRS